MFFAFLKGLNQFIIFMNFKNFSSIVRPKISQKLPKIRQDTAINISIDRKQCTDFDIMNFKFL